MNKMGFKDQLNKLKDNWLMIVLVVLVLLFVILGSSGMNLGSMSSDRAVSSYGGAYNKVTEQSLGYNGYYPSYGGTDFAPDVSERKIVKTTSLSTEVERGTFSSAEDKLNNIVKSSDSFLLSSSSNKYGVGNKVYYTGSYSIKVDVTKYDSVVAQLKEIGEVTNFNENAQDVTGTYTNLNIELAAEKERLTRFNDLYVATSSTSEKIDLTDKIFNQERTVKYLEDSIKNMDSRIDYSTISVSLYEKQPTYVNVALVKFSNLVKSMVGSFNGLLYFLFVTVPWAVAIGLVWLIFRLFKKKEEPIKVQTSNKK
jgi:hypothetical protein